MTKEICALLANGELSPCFSKTVYRYVETNKTLSTLAVVDTLEEAEVLEAMIDNTKPALSMNSVKDNSYDYLIKTPFRYPPLLHGSRFGSKMQPSFFYASGSVETCLSECAYYRHLFISDSEAKLSGKVVSQHMIFQVKIKTNNMADLTLDKYQQHQVKLRSPDDYSFTQKLGSYIREELGGDVIKFFSARSRGVNYAISDIRRIASKSPMNKQQFSCITSNDEVLVNINGSLQRIEFKI